MINMLASEWCILHGKAVFTSSTPTQRSNSAWVHRNSFFSYFSCLLVDHDKAVSKLLDSLSVEQWLIF